MKGIVAVSLIGLMGVATLSIAMDNSSVTTRKAELEDTLTTSMWNTLKASNVYQMYDVTDQEMSAELLRNIAENMNSDTSLDVYIYERSNKGILDVGLQGTFKHLNGENGIRETRKTLVYDKIPTNPE